jgi:hypothetical protein
MPAGKHALPRGLPAKPTGRNNVTADERGEPEPGKRGGPHPARAGVERDRVEPGTVEPYCAREEGPVVSEDVCNTSMLSAKAKGFVFFLLDLHLLDPGHRTNLHLHLDLLLGRWSRLWPGCPPHHDR